MRIGVGIASIGVAAVGAATAARLRHNERLRRTARVYLLTVRRGVSYLGHRVRGFAADDERRRQLDERFAIRSAEDVTRELGHMKGAIMKAGQFLSFVLESLPDEAQATLAQLQADAPPMSPTLAERVVEEELGAHPHDLFLDWGERPVAAASIGQVHRAVTRDGRIVAVKVQYPGVREAIGADLDNAELLYGMVSAFSFRGLDVRGLVDELRDRMTDELDYRIEVANQQRFHERYRDHPFISVPATIPELSATRVMTSEWVDGWDWDEMVAATSMAERNHIAEVIFRFVQGSVYRHKVFNADPHPGNYRFHADGSVTFLDFGLVKSWTDDEIATLWPVIDPVLDGDASETVARMVDAGFLGPDHGLDPDLIWAYASAPYLPYLEPTFRFSRDFVKRSLESILDVRGPHVDVIRQLNLPPSFVLLDRVVWGVSAIMGRLDAEGPWRGILDEYRSDAAPVTELGSVERVWAQRPR